MKYQIKNIEQWVMYCPHRTEIREWKNGEVHDIDEEMAREAEVFGGADPVSCEAESIEEAAEKEAVEAQEEAEEPKNEAPQQPDANDAKEEEQKEVHECPKCGKVCKSEAGLASHMRNCKK